MAKQSLDYALFRQALRRWIEANNESYDVDYRAAYESYIKQRRDMSWLDSYISEIAGELSSPANKGYAYARI